MCFYRVKCAKNVLFVYVSKFGVIRQINTPTLIQRYQSWGFLFLCPKFKFNFLDKKIVKS
jgi:hypothetical protein